jgi:tetratricopeptide (TPR) repeat protein
MRRQRLMMGGMVLLAVSTLAGIGWRYARPAGTEPAAEPLPVPPFPPRITQGDTYEQCLALLGSDPAGARTQAETWLLHGGGDGARHCQALAEIALGRPDVGAGLLEQLAQGSTAPGLAKASLLAQAVQARLMLREPEHALADATAALALAPQDADLLVDRAQAAVELAQPEAAIADLTQALALEPRRSDALVLRARALRQANRLDQAERDVLRAISLAPDDPEALLERGILRQRRGDVAGARADWLRAQMLEPAGTVGDLAQQNLALLDAGPAQP